ncbi:Semaphorin-1A [Polyplax serrata]|uniref:Semaphorin-1A n=1 Tax=Polyplax serrata TaxID=468196 RepID=A0AAN8XLI9_POLSC
MKNNFVLVEFHSRELVGGKEQKFTGDDCQNYIRVLAKISQDKLLICGTNAYKPYCRYYRYKNGEYTVEEEFEGGGLCPYDPDHNSTAVYADGQLYAATVADFQGGDSLIYREPLRTERSDLKQLNDPSFVNSMAYEDYVFFFFRETAVEYMNCGKKVYSRVARVCKHDKGGPHQFGDRWTSFLKSRLNCSVPGDYPFYFDEIQSMSEIVEGVYGQRSAQLLYGVFTTPINSIGGSAVCAFTMNSILETFEGPFKEQETMNSNWLPVAISKVPEPRPGQCVNDSRTLPDVSVNFVKSHTLMDTAVPAFFSRPVLIRISSQYRFSMIAVDPQVRTPDGRAYDVLFIGTDDGKVVKAVNTASFDSNNTVETVVLEEIQIIPLGFPVKNLQVVQGNLIVLTDDEIQSIPVQRCDNENATTCRACVALQDPYCAWDVLQMKCVTSGLAGWDGDKKRFIQSVTKGDDRACPHIAEVPPVPTSSQTKTTGETDVYEEINHTCPPCPICLSEITTLPCLSEATTEAHSGSPHGHGRTPGHFMEADLNNEIIIELDESNVISDTLAGLSHPGAKLPSSQENMVIYTAETLGIAVATSILAALVVGFIGGFLFSRRCRSDDYTDMPRFPDNQRHQLNRLTDSGLNADLSQHINNKAINLVLNVPPKNANGKNANSSAENKPIQKKREDDEDEDEDDDEERQEDSFTGGENNRSDRKSINERSQNE